MPFLELIQSWVQNPWLYVALITMLPWIELRGGIPAGILMGLDPVLVLIVAVIANCAIIYPSFVFLEWFFHLMKKVKWMDRRITKIHEAAKPYVEKYGVIGLMLFVAVPLPGTGAYAGTLVAHLMCMKNKKAFISIALGVAIAGLAVFLIATMFKETFGWLLDLKLF